MTYCGIGALSFLNRLPDSLWDAAPKAQEANEGDNSSVLTGLLSLEGTIRWLAERQVGYFPHEDDESEEDDEGPQQHEKKAAEAVNEHWPHETPFAGFSGRRNKVADTCYSFWVGASLAVSPPTQPFVLHLVFSIVIYPYPIPDSKENGAHRCQRKSPFPSPMHPTRCPWRFWQSPRKPTWFVYPNIVSAILFRENTDFTLLKMEISCTPTSVLLPSP
jgi:hypothetical protein